MDDNSRRDILHAQYDAQLDERRRQLEAELSGLEDERKKGHEHINSLPTGLLRIFVEGIRIPLTPEPYAPVSTSHPPPSTSNGGNAEIRFPLRDKIRKLMDVYDETTVITSLLVYDDLIKGYPEIKESDEHKTKARVSMALTKLVEDGILLLVRKGGGSIPHLYRKRPADDLDGLFGENSEGEKVEAAVAPAAPLPVISKEVSN